MSKKLGEKVLKNFTGTHEDFMRLMGLAHHQIDDESEIDLKTLKLPELKNLAKKRGLKGYSTLRKADLIKKLEISLKTLDDTVNGD